MTEISRDDLAARFATRAVHAGKIADPLAGAVMTPIYQTSTYVQQGLGKHKGYEYARTQNPTREALERNIAALEGGRHGFAFASGLAAVDAVLKLLSQGDHVVSGENVYGGTHRQMTHIWARHGLAFTFVDAADAANVAAAVTPRTRMVYAETPTNPMMRLCDLQAVAEIARRQMSGFGGMISIELGSVERARRLVERTRIFALAESLGGVESLIGHPASMTHASVPPEMRRAMGLTDSLVRLSVGIEDVDDLIADLEQALDGAGRGRASRITNHVFSG